MLLSVLSGNGTLIEVSSIANVSLGGFNVVIVLLRHLFYILNGWHGRFDNWHCLLGNVLLNRVLDLDILNWLLNVLDRLHWHLLLVVNGLFLVLDGWLLHLLHHDWLLDLLDGHLLHRLHHHLLLLLWRWRALDHGHSLHWWLHGRSHLHLRGHLSDWRSLLGWSHHLLHGHLVNLRLHHVLGLRLWLGNHGLLRVVLRV